MDLYHSIVVVAWCWVCMVLCFWVCRRVAVAFNYYPFECCLPGGLNAFFGGNRLRSDDPLFHHGNDYEMVREEWL